MRNCDDLVARARGLSTHLLAPEQMNHLCAATSKQLDPELRALGIIADLSVTALDIRQLELALRRKAAQRLRVLANWAGSRQQALTPLFEDEDVRSLRAIVRGVFSGLPVGDRLTGLIATPALPERALQTLASCADVSKVAALLVAWRNPYGEALAIEAERARPDLFHFELALMRVFADRAQQAARHDKSMQRFSSQIVDFANLHTALVLVSHAVDSATATLFIKGGRVIQLSDLEFARTAGIPDALARKLHSRVQGTPLAAAFEPGSPADVEYLGLNAMVQEFRQLSRLNPTSLAPVILFVLRQRAELHTLLRIVWSVMLGMPPVMIRRSIGLAA